MCSQLAMKFLDISPTDPFIAVLDVASSSFFLLYFTLHGIPPFLVTEGLVQFFSKNCTTSKNKSLMNSLHYHNRRSGSRLTMYRIIKRHSFSCYSAIQILYMCFSYIVFELQNPLYEWRKVGSRGGVFHGTSGFSTCIPNHENWPLSVMHSWLNFQVKMIVRPFAKSLFLFEKNWSMHQFLSSYQYEELG